MPARPRHLVLLLAASVLLSLSLVEIGLRAAGFSRPSLYTRDPVRGGALRPGAHGWWTTEGRDYVRINSRGLRDREHAAAKPAATVRVAVLGDSYAEALQLPMAAAFWAVAERELAGCAALGGRPVEVINFGVSGYGTAQELLTLRHAVWEYEPDVVVLAFLSGNDVRNNARDLEGDPDRPYFVERDGQLVLDQRFLERYPSPAGMRLRTLAADALNEVRLLQLLRAGVEALRSRGAAGAPGTGQAGQAGQAAGLDDAVYAPPRTAAWEAAWRVTERLLGQFADDVRAHGALPLVVGLSNPAQVAPDPAWRAAFARELGVDDLFYPDRRLAAACAQRGIPVLLLAPLLQEHADRTGELLHGFRGRASAGHWNARGHRLAGELIAREVCRELSGGAGTPARGAAR